ncbi:MAG: cobalt/nickel transport system permease protein [Clostridia bacterium]|nr:cobalt/nickel transport system permease protein [Clostridia bacterium]
MHIPDGFLTAQVYLPAAGLSAAGLAWGLKRTEKLDEKRIPLLGAMGAFIFAAQMVNFPVAPGVSGHLLGGALAALSLGPAAAGVIMTAVLLIQAFFMHDGGITALGANVLNMAILAPWVAYFTYQAVTRVLPGRFGNTIGIFFASWLSVLLAALAAALELGWSGMFALNVILTTMALWHILIGIGEGILTTLALNYLVQLKPADIAGEAKE